jgi:uncharacterized protein involved in exopolysaccharide biosynthesis
MDQEKTYLDLNQRKEELPSPEPENEKIDLASYLLVLVKYRKFIILNFITICVVVAGISLLFPNWYTAKTTILPPEKQGLSLGLSSSLLSGLSSLGGGMSLPLMATPSDVYAAIAKSRSVAEEVIQAEDLSQYYDLKSMEQTLKEVWGHLSVSVGDEGMVAIAYEDKNPTKAASIANAFALKLDEVNRRTFTSKAKNSRLFIEERLGQTKKDLAAAEENLRNFQQENKAIAIDEQTKAAIGAAADLQAQLVLVELELNVLSKNVEDTPELRQLQFKRQEILKQLEKLEKGGKGREAGLLGVPFEKVPDLTLEYARLFRELKIQETVFELLTAEYEKAKIEESKDTPTIQVLDRAVPPERKSKPKRSFMVVFAGGFSLLFSIFFVFFREFMEKSRLKNPEEYHRLQMVYATLREDWHRIRNRLPFARK